MEQLEKIYALRSTLGELRQLGEEFKKNLTDILSTIEQDIFAPIDGFEIWGNRLFAWLRKSTECYELYTALFNKPLPNTLSELEKILDAEEKKIRTASIFEQAEKFLFLVTEDEALKKNLHDHQIKLKKLLAKKNQDAKLKTSVEPYAKFFKAMQETNPVEKFSISDGLREFFSNDLIGLGIFGNRLTLQVPEVGKVPAPKSKEKKIAQPPPSSEPSEFVKLIESDVALLKAEDFKRWNEIFIIDKEERNKPFSEKVFKRDFRNFKQIDILKTVVDYISVFGFLAIPSFCPDKISHEQLESAAQLLLGKGYIQKYEIEGFGGFYGVTNNFWESLIKNDGKRAIGFQFFRNGTIQRVLTRIVYFWLYDLEIARKNSFYQMHFADQSFLAAFDDAGKLDLFVGCFWDTVSECDSFLDKLARLLDRDKRIGRMFIVGLHLEQTTKLHVALKVVLAEHFPNDAAQYLYAFNEDTFYLAETGESISTEEIWTSPMPDNLDESVFREILALEKDASESEKVSLEKAYSEESSTSTDVYEFEEIFGYEDEAEPDKKLFRDVKGLLLEEKFYCATAYLKAQSMISEEVEPIYRELAFALNDPLLNEKYNAAAILTFVSQNEKPFNEALITAAALRTFFYNDVEFDYNIPALYDKIKYFRLFKENAALGQLVLITKDFKIQNQKGADYFVEGVANNRQTTAEFIGVVRDAEVYYRQFFESEFRGETGRTTARTKQRLFDSNSEFCAVFKLVKAPLEEYTTAALNTVKEFLAENFIKKGAEPKEKNLDSIKIAAWVERCWEEVKSKNNKNSLVGDRRSNINNNLERAGEIMCAWVKYAENLSGDAAELQHDKIFADMTEAAETAYKKLGKKLKGKTMESAGILILAKTLKEISARLDGSYDDTEHKYFYVKFLCGEQIILDENYLPKLDFNISDGTRDGICEQILKHASAKLPSIEKRIEQIFQRGGDDFGSAQLLDDYLKATKGESFITQKKYALEECIAGVGKDIASKLEEFKGGVELAHIQGQLNDDADKEKILQVVDSCYTYAKASGNYGVFFRVKKFWENKIKENASELCKSLEADLQQAIDTFKQSDGNFDSAALTESVSEIKKLLIGGNFASAKTLIEELSRGKPYRRAIAEDVTLSRFIEDYGECYGKVQNISTSLKNLLAKQSSDKNKFYKARGELIDSWLPNGMPDSTSGKEKYLDRVWDLLELLGFDLESMILSDDSDSKSLTFSVRLKKSFQMMHTHPIAAFGSEAEIGKSGFRVTCLFGQFPQENLIDYFKKLDAGNTLILLDHALKLPERRRLARAIKGDRSLMHIFAVVDRVVMMYLIKNCSAQIKTKRINDTLMSLIMPFSRCQPYIWDPQKPLPPEMFIGREKEIFDVKSLNGANIVYGGRQLGKSALLKMACREIDGNKNQRAIYVEIRNKDYKAAALYTSRELTDAEFFLEPVETDDWEVLTREIKRRLSTETPSKINYFLLTLDEADKFIESCAEVHYSPIDDLARIQRTDYNGSRFKFVIAGLRNVVRFKQERAKSDNPILPVLKSLPIKPFAFEEARKLLEVPLRCLGLQFADDKLTFTIAETALYFPGIIQLFCEKLLLTLFEPNNTSYGENAPPYEITESHIKKVLADEEFIRDIKDKIEITLRLGDDKYYYVIAQILAYLYHENPKDDGYSPAEILASAKSYGLVKELYLPSEEARIDALMVELCELNILQKNASGKYLFSRPRIFNYMGTADKIEEELLNLMAEAANG